MRIKTALFFAERIKAFLNNLIQINWRELGNIPTLNRVAVKICLYFIPTNNFVFVLYIVKYKEHNNVDVLDSTKVSSLLRNWVRSISIRSWVQFFDWMTGAYSLW